MSKGNLLTDGQKGKNFPYQFNHLLALGDIITAIIGITPPGGLATETTLQSVLAAIQDGIDFEAKLVVDAANVTWLEVRVWNQGTGSFDPPVYYAAGSNVAGSPTLPITYINPQTLLAQIVSNTTGLNLEATQLSLLAQLTAINADLDVALSTRASEVTLLAVLAALNTIDSVLDTIALDTANLDTPLSTLATEATLLIVNTALSNILTEVQSIDTRLTGAVKTATYVIATVDGSTPAGVQSLSMRYEGANGTFNGAVVPNNATLIFQPNKGEDTLAAVVYTVPTTGSARILITYIS